MEYHSVSVSLPFATSLKAFLMGVDELPTSGQGTLTLILFPPKQDRETPCLSDAIEEWAEGTEFTRKPSMGFQANEVGFAGVALGQAGKP